MDQFVKCDRPDIGTFGTHHDAPTQPAPSAAPAFCYPASPKPARVPPDSTHRPHTTPASRIDSRDKKLAAETLPGASATAEATPQRRSDAPHRNVGSMLPNTRDFPPLTPFAASVVEGKRRLPLSDTENLMVGAFGGTLECAVQSEFPGLCPDLRPTVLATQTTPSDRTRPTPSRRSQCPSSR